MRKKGTDLKTKIFLIIITFILGIVLLGRSLDNDHKLNFAEVFVKDTALFFTSIVNSPFQYLQDINTDFEKYIVNINKSDYKKIAAENASLKADLKALRKESSAKYPDQYTALTSEVVVRNINTWYHQITIDNGSNQNVKVGDAITNNSGLVGVVNTTSKNYATVDLIFNNKIDMIIPATILSESGDEWGYIQGYDAIDETLVFNKINNDINVRTGDMVVTSSLGGKLPVGIIIGNVSTIVRDEYGIVDKLKITPRANFTNLRYVTALVRGKQ